MAECRAQNCNLLTACVLSEKQRKASFFAKMHSRLAAGLKTAGFPHQRFNTCRLRARLLQCFPAGGRVPFAPLAALWCVRTQYNVDLYQYIAENEEKTYGNVCLCAQTILPLQRQKDKGSAAMRCSK